MTIQLTKGLKVEFFPQGVKLSPERIRRGHRSIAWMTGIATVVLALLSAWEAYRGNAVWPLSVVMAAMQALLCAVSIRRSRA